MGWVGSSRKETSREVKGNGRGLPELRNHAAEKPQPRPGPGRRVGECGVVGGPGRGREGSDQASRVGAAGRCRGEWVERSAGPPQKPGLGDCGG